MDILSFIAAPSPELRLLSSSPSHGHCPNRRPSKTFVVSASARRKRSSADGDKAIPGKTKQELSHMLRTDAAVAAVERKAGAKATNARTRLWPRSVLEALDDAIAHNRCDSALKIFGLLRKQFWYQPKTQTYTKLFMMLGKCKQPQHATSLFRIMLSDGLQPTLDVYTSLVGAYARSGLFDEAIRTVDEMKMIGDCKPDAHTYTILIDSCCKLGRFGLIPDLLNEMSYLGIECNIVTYNAVINGYGKARMLDDMDLCLSNMLESGKCLPDIYTMNSVIWAYGNCQRIIEMESWFDRFQHMGIEPDMHTFNTLIKSYGKAGMHDKMGLVLSFMNKRFFSPTTVTYNIIIDCFGKIGNIEKMEYYFRLMKVQGVKPNPITYCSLVSGYSKAGLLDKVSAIIRQTENTDVALDTTFFNSVINAYGQAGEVKIMEEMFLLMKDKKCNPDRITFLTMIQAYVALGMDEAAKELETRMCNIQKEVMDPFE